jgi:tetratricopeptide (TPR) repeat protein
MLGDAQLQSDQATEALGSYRAALEISRKLAAADASDAGAQRDLSISFSKLGDLQLQTGQPAEALESYRQALQIKRALATADPSDTQAQRDLLTWLGKIGDVQLQSGNAAEALKSFQSAVEVGENLVAVDPSDARTRRNLCVAYNMVGDVQLQSMQAAEALVSYQKMHAMREDLARHSEGEREDVRAQCDLILSFGTLGMGHRAVNDHQRSAAAFASALEIARRLSDEGTLPPELDRIIPELDSDQKKSEIAAIALGDWDALLKQPADVLPEMLEMRATYLVQAGLTDDAVQAAEKLRELNTTTVDQLYNTARVYCLCAAAIQTNKGELTAEQAVERQRCLTYALETLREAIAAGWDDFEHMQQNSDLAPLRELPEFQELIEGT